MKITQVICSAGRTGFYFDDQKAIKAGAKSDGSLYVGEPKTPGFTRIRQAGESISVQIVLENGQIGWGDCAAVQYSAPATRPLVWPIPLFQLSKRMWRAIWSDNRPTVSAAWPRTSTTCR